MDLSSLLPLLTAMNGQNTNNANNNLLASMLPNILSGQNSNSNPMMGMLLNMFNSNLNNKNNNSQNTNTSNQKNNAQYEATPYKPNNFTTLNEQKIEEPSSSNFPPYKDLKNAQQENKTDQIFPNGITCTPTSNVNQNIKKEAEPLDPFGYRRLY